MVAKAVSLLCASVLLLQSVYGQYSCSTSNLGLANGNVHAPASNNINLAQGLGCSNNLGFTSYGQTNGLGVASNGLNLVNCNIGPQALPETTLTVLSGSPAFEDGGITIVGDKLEIGGNVFVSGAIPFYSTVALNGNVPSGGQASVSYTAGPLSFGSGGYGQGLASIDGVGSGVNLASALGTNVGGVNYGANLAASGLCAGAFGNRLAGVGIAGSQGGSKSCGCGY